MPRRLHLIRGDAPTLTRAADKGKGGVTRLRTVTANDADSRAGRAPAATA